MPLFITDANCVNFFLANLEIQKVIYFILNFISSSILTINTGPISLKVFNVNNGIPLEKANECTLTVFLVGLIMAR